jgi:cell division control protein 45
MVYVFDSHRPLNLHNLFGSSQVTANDKVIVIDDGQTENIAELKAAFEELEVLSFLCSLGAIVIQKMKRMTKRMKRMIMKAKYLLLMQGSKRKRPIHDDGDNAVDGRVQKREYRRIIQEYYSEGSYFGLPVVNAMYSLATQLGKASNRFLWYSIVGLSGNYIYGKLNIIQYTQLALEYKEEVERLSIRNAPIDESQSILGSEKQVDTNADDYSIRFLEDLQLVLLRHWNLYDSMFHSTYVATKLGVWKEKGRQAITNLLVQMGFPQKESKQYFREMSVDYKRSLKQTLMDLAPKYKMPNILFPSFERNYGYLVTFSASDIVYGVTALLDCGSTFLQKRGISGYEDVLDHSYVTTMLNAKQREVFQESVQSREGGLVGAGVGTRTVPGAIATHIIDYMAKLELDQRTDWVKHFYLAYDALERYFEFTESKNFAAWNPVGHSLSADFGSNSNIDLGQAISTNLRSFSVGHSETHQCGSHRW